MTQCHQKECDAEAVSCKVLPGGWSAARIPTPVAVPAGRQPSGISPGAGSVPDLAPGLETGVHLVKAHPHTLGSRFTLPATP